MTLTLLHPAIQHHLTSSLGWCRLRPLQERAVEPVIDGEDVLISAGPGAGRVEAALVPLLSRMLSEAWEGISVLVLGPSVARLDQIRARVEPLGDCVGRTCAILAQEELRRCGVPGGPGPDVLLLETCASSPLLPLECAIPDTVRALVVDAADSLLQGEPGAECLAELARLEARSVHGLQRIGLAGPTAEADQLLLRLSPARRGVRRGVRLSGGSGFGRS